MSVCDYDLNATLAEELNKYDILQKPSSRPASPSATANESVDLNQSVCSSMRVAFVPDVSGILSLIDDPSLVNFVTEHDDDTVDLDGTTFNLNECLEKLKAEADSLLQLSENLVPKRVQDNRDVDRNDSIEEEDGSKSKKSLNNSATSKDEINSEQKQRLSLPIYLPVDRKVGTNSELNEVKNRLVLAERKRQELENELAASMAEQSRLNEELRLVTIKLNGYIDGHSEELSEGYVGTFPMIFNFIETRFWFVTVMESVSCDRHNVNQPTRVRRRSQRSRNVPNSISMIPLHRKMCRNCCNWSKTSVAKETSSSKRRSK